MSQTITVFLSRDEYQHLCTSRLGRMQFDIMDNVLSRMHCEQDQVILKSSYYKGNLNRIMADSYYFSDSVYNSIFLLDMFRS